MASASGEVATGMALAHQQAASGDLVGAASTLDRVLIAHPDADAARLAHAGLLCRLDDTDGARVELAALAGHAVSDAAWAEVTSACGPIARPEGATS
ncbi:MAG: tetratricopeptide repeat protein [Sphingomonas sp.]